MGKPISYQPSIPTQLFDGKNVAVLLTEWHRDIVEMMAADAERVLATAGVRCDRFVVPGAFELPSALHYLFAEGGADPHEDPKYDAAICLGVVVQGETPHFTFISQSVFQAIQEFNAHNDGQFPVLCGVLTTNTLQQAVDRADGTHSRKGVELAQGVLTMFRFQEDADGKRLNL